MTIFSGVRATTCSMAARETTFSKEARGTTPTSSTVPISIPMPTTRSARRRAQARIPSSARFLTGLQILWRFSTSQDPLQSRATEMLETTPLPATAYQTRFMERKVTTSWMAARARILSSVVREMTPSSLITPWMVFPRTRIPAPTSLFHPLPIPSRIMSKISPSRGMQSSQAMETA